MPDPDPLPPLRPIRRQFLRVMRVAALFAMAIAALAMVLVAHGDTEPHVHMLIATALGAGLMVLLGIALMTLLFLSNRMGQDSDAADFTMKDDNDYRP